MTATDYRNARRTLGLTQSELALVLDVGRKTIIRRESGGVITAEAALAISLLEMRQLERQCHKTTAMVAQATPVTVDQMATEMGLECCDFLAKDPRDCDVCSAAKVGELIWVQMVGAYEGGTQEVEYYACSSCVAIKHAFYFSSENKYDTHEGIGKMDSISIGKNPSNG